MVLSSRRGSSASRATSHGTTLVLVGIVLTLLGRGLDGFLRGFLEGAGIALLLLGVWVLSPVARRRLRGGTDADRGGSQGRGGGWWLPSRDGDG